jgi:hypothetical protein
MTGRMRAAPSGGRVPHFSTFFARSGDLIFH